MKLIFLFGLVLVLLISGCGLDLALDEEIQAAVRAKDPDLCEDMEDRRRDNCLTRVAKALGDTGPCQRIEGAGFVSRCVIDVAVSKKDVGVCDELSETPYVLCVQQVAVETKRPAHCTRISEEEYPFDRNKCLSDTAIEIGDPKYCEDVPLGQHRENCYLHIGLRNRDYEICDKITSPGLQDQCNRQIALSLVNPSLCARIEGDGDRDNCYESISKVTNDETLCNLIINDNSAQRCLRNIN